MTPLTLAAMLAANPVETVQKAIAQRLGELLQGVTVVTHPGKLSISQLEVKAISATPGVAIGWSRVRDATAIDGSVSITVDWIAYVVTEHKLIDGRRVERDAIALGIGFALLGILADPATTTWGLTRIMPPAENPPAQLSPVFTIGDQEKGSSYLAVTWTQTVVDQSPGLFSGDAPTFIAATDDEDRASAEAAFGPNPGDVPADVRALWRIE